MILAGKQRLSNQDGFQAVHQAFAYLSYQLGERQQWSSIIPSMGAHQHYPVVPSNDHLIHQSPDTDSTHDATSHVTRTFTLMRKGKAWTSGPEHLINSTCQPHPVSFFQRDDGWCLVLRFVCSFGQLSSSSCAGRDFPNAIKQQRELLSHRDAHENPSTADLKLTEHVHEALQICSDLFHLSISSHYSPMLFPLLHSGRTPSGPTFGLTLGAETCVSHHQL